jgi:hypothetical protein
MRSTKTMAIPKEKAETHRYMLEIKHLNPGTSDPDHVYYQYPSGARNRILAILKNQRKMFFSLQDHDGIIAVDELIKQAGWIGDDGGVVDGVIDPYTGTRFRAEVIRRQTL